MKDSTILLPLLIIGVVGYSLYTQFKNDSNALTPANVANTKNGNIPIATTANNLVNTLLPQNQPVTPNDPFADNSNDANIYNP